ncbi:hypothetical protein [Alistipes sp.]|uniref:hypothetical protein n=1 Tax=Alistipes sp. TaxID=1872444 RepID=UPI003AF1C99A
MKKFSLLMIIACFLFSPVEAKKPDFYTVGVPDEDVYFYKMPDITLKLRQQPPTVHLLPGLKAFLHENPSPRVIVRVIDAGHEIAEQERIRPYYNYIEEQLTRIGFQVLDRGLISQLTDKNGYVNYTDIRKKIDADLIIEVSWLRFAQEEDRIRIDTIIADGPVEELRYKTVDSVEYTNLKKPGKDGSVWLRRYGFYPRVIGYTVLNEMNGPSIEYELDGLNDFKHQIESFRPEVFLSVVSATFKIIQIDKGTVGGTIKTVYSPLKWEKEITIVSKGLWSHGWKRTPPYYFHFRSYSTGDGGILKASKENYNPHWWLSTRIVFKQDQKDILSAIINGWFKEYFTSTTVINGKLTFCVPDGERFVRFAADLNAGIDAKISDAKTRSNYGEQTATSHSQTTTGSGRASTYYNSYNSSTYGHYGGTTQGGSHSATQGGSTTIYTDAEYLKCSDFYEYYRPLSEKFAEELAKYIQ